MQGRQAPRLSAGAARHPTHEEETCFAFYIAERTADGHRRVLPAAHHTCTYPARPRPGLTPLTPAMHTDPVRLGPVCMVAATCTPRCAGCHFHALAAGAPG